MGYRGGDLEGLFGESTTGPPTRRAMRDIADAGGRAMTDAAKRHTPVLTGRTRESLQQTPVEKVVGGYRSGVESHHWKARFIEHGVKAHDVKPKRKKALSTPEGPRAGAHSPGMAGAHMVQRAAVEVEATVDQIAAPHLEAWAAEVEAAASKHRGIT